MSLLFFSHLCFALFHLGTLFIYVASLTAELATVPKELGFEVYNNVASPPFDMYLLQPKLDGSITAFVGPVESTHSYNMASVSVFLNTHNVYVHRTYVSPLFALCIVENAHLLAQQDMILMCVFHVNVPTFAGPFLSESSCLLHTLNESECASRIDLEFLSQYQTFPASLGPVVITYNISAFQLNYTGGNTQYFERPDVIGSLIHPSMSLPPVSVLLLRDVNWITLFKDASGQSVMQWGVPGMQLGSLFSIFLRITRSSFLQEFRMRLVLSSSLRYRYKQELHSEGARSWRVQVNPKRYGALIRGRKLMPELAVDGLSHNLSNSTEPRYVVIAELVVEEFMQTDSTILSPRPVESSQASHDADDDHAVAEGISSVDQPTQEMMHRPEPPLRFQLLQWAPTNFAYSRNDTNTPTLSLALPQMIPSADSLHILVQFEPKDILEPPWYPASPSPEPYKLRVFSLLPNSPGATTHVNSLDAVFGTTSAGRLKDITDHVLCRPATSRTSLGDPFLGASTSANPSCPTSMQQAPSEVEQFSFFPNDPLFDTQLVSLAHAAGGLGFRPGLSDQLLLTLTSSDEATRHVSIVPSIYGPLRSTVTGKLWAWRDWRGPTVRRWMLEGFRIHVASSLLRRIKGWRVANTTTQNPPPLWYSSENKSILTTDRFEQTPITVTARIYTMRPGTGQRLYLGSSEHPHIPADLQVHGDVSTSGHSEDRARPLEFDITRLLPAWAIVVRSVSNSVNDVNPLPSAYVFHDVFSKRPHLVGLRAGRVMLGLVAASGDPQHLASTYVDVGRPQLHDGTVAEEDPLSVVSIRADCVEPALRISGRLSSYASEGMRSTGAYDADNGNPHSGASGSGRFGPVMDLSLPQPQRLSFKLLRAESSDTVLVSAAASSATRSPESLRSLLFQKASRLEAIGHKDRPASAVSCPVHLLSMSLILSDGSVLHAHRTPPGHLRISVFGTDLVWDPAIPLKPAGNPEDRLAPYLKQSIRVRINSLVVWPPMFRATHPVVPFSVPLGAMDDVIGAVRSGRPLTDPGSPLSPLKLLTSRTSEVPTTPSVQSANQVGPTARGPEAQQHPAGMHPMGDRASVLIDPQYYHGVRFSNHSNSQSTTAVTYILIGVGFLVLLLFVTNGLVLWVVRNKRRQRAGSSRDFRRSAIKELPMGIGAYTGQSVDEKSSGDNHYCNTGTTAGTPRTPLVQSHAEEHQSHRYFCSSSPRPPDVVPMAAGLSCGSVGSGASGHMGSASSGPTGSLKQSILMGTTANPYTITSEPSLAGAFHSQLTPLSSNLAYVIPSWNSAARLCHSRRMTNTNTNSSNQSPTSVGWLPSVSQLIPIAPNPGCTSGVGSVCTAEGCSDEGAASGPEVMGLSEELLHLNGQHGIPVNRCVSGPFHLHIPIGNGQQSATEGTNSTASGFSGQLNRTFLPTFRHTTANGTGVGSLSGESSAGELNDCLQVNPQSSMELVERDHLPGGTPRSPDRCFTHQQTYPLGQYSANFKGQFTPMRDASRRHASPVLHNTQMSESFTISACGRHPSSLSQRPVFPRNDVFQRNPPSPTRPVSNESGSIDPVRSFGVDNGLDQRCASIPIGYDRIEANGESALDDLDSSPVPMPPVLLLNSCAGLRSLSPPTSPFKSHDQSAASVPESRALGGSYKRSDSFGMATKPSLSQLAGFSPLNRDIADSLFCSPTCDGHTAVPDTMVGDTLDLSDEISSESKASSAFRKSQKFVTVAKSFPCSPNVHSMETDDPTYLYKIPPPEL
ncbi:unnamed protein product [Dicrocoelium dendriticum]|nr:unnamed protein product [Dicrocoelium dendriticum]